VRRAVEVAAFGRGDAGGRWYDEEAVAEARGDERSSGRQRRDDHETTEDFPQPHAARHRPLRQAEQSLQGKPMALRLSITPLPRRISLAAPAFVVCLYTL